MRGLLRLLVAMFDYQLLALAAVHWNQRNITVSSSVITSLVANIVPHIGYFAEWIWLGQSRLECEAYDDVIERHVKENWRESAFFTPGILVLLE